MSQLNPYQEGVSPSPSANSPKNDLTTVDWIICIIFSGIGCILAIIRIIRGDPTGKKMLAVSLGFIAIKIIAQVAFVLAAAGS